jgi:hypothetical protein
MALDIFAVPAMSDAPVVNVNAPSVRTSLVCGCHFSVAAVIAYTAFFPLHVSTACSDRHNNNTNAHFGYVHHLNNIYRPKKKGKRIRTVCSSSRDAGDDNTS